LPDTMSADQAFRTSPEVYLIFGANKQGSFAGYAIMRSGIASVARTHPSHSSQGQDSPRSSNGSRSGLAKPTSGGNSRTAGLLSPRGADIQEDDEGIPPTTRSFRLSSTDSTNAAIAMSSPGEMTPGDELISPTDLFRWNQTAPHPGHNRISVPGDPMRAMTFDTKALARIRAEEALKQEIAAKAKADADDFELDQDAALNAQRMSPTKEMNSVGGVSRKDMVSSDESNAPAAVKAHRQSAVVPDGGDNAKNSNDKNDVTTTEAVANSSSIADQHDFKIEWIRVGDLSFSAIKHLRNPWNQDKEVKVSRDGTELEPG
jgi:hypothetical protein